MNAPRAICWATEGTQVAEHSATCILCVDDRAVRRALTAPVFDVHLPPGLDFTLQNSPTPQKYLIETMPGGVALLDYNNDGLLDIFLVNGGRITSPMQTPENFDRHDPRYWNRLYRQNKDGSFTDVTETSRPGRCRRRKLRHGRGGRRL